MMSNIAGRPKVIGRFTSSEVKVASSLHRSRRVTTGDGFEVDPAVANASTHLGLLPPLLQATATLVWLPQAAALSYAIGGIAEGAPLGAVILPAIAVLFLGFLKAGLDAAGTRLAFKSARISLSRIRERAITALAARSPLDVARPASGLAASTVAEQAEMIVPYLARFKPARLKATLVPLAILMCVLSLSWAAAFVLLVAAPLIPVFMALIGWRAKAASEKHLAEIGGMNGFLLDRLRGLSTLRALGAVDFTALRLRSEAQSLRLRTMTVLRIAFLSSAVLELFAALGVAMTAVYVGFHLLGQIGFGTWGNKLTLAEGLFILLLAPAMFEPLRELSAVWHDRASGEAALKALEDFDIKGTELPGATNDGVAQASIVKAPPSIDIDGLRFCYPGSRAPVLDNFTLSVAAGEHVALLGPSGCGKSTILALLAGLAPADRGRVVIGDTPLDDDTANALRKRMAWVGQTPYLFAGSIASNISVGRVGIGSEEIASVLGVTLLQAVADRHGNALVGENGSGLSGGEALRLILARAAVDPSSDLILADEPTAHLDRETADEITGSLLALAKGRTMIVATHDPAFASRLDRTIDLRLTASSQSKVRA